MSSTFCGSVLRLSVFGQSHSEAIGMTLDGLPSGFQIDPDRLQRFLLRRAPGKHDWSTARREEDQPEFLSGLFDGKTCGSPLTAVIRNRDTRSADYDELRTVPRPGHADYTAGLRYGGYQDYRGGGHFSGRLTAPLCVAGGILLQMLSSHGIAVDARILSVADVSDTAPFTASVADKEFPTVSDGAAQAMKAVIAQARAEGDSVGGIIECVIRGVPGGIGEPIFDGIENRIAQLAFAVPAVKGIEFGTGFASTRLRGSENNDGYTVMGSKVKTLSNHSGGILGGISNGEEIVFRAAIKPTPSIAKAQQSINLDTMEPVLLSVRGRHDPCIVPRAVPVMEAVAAIAVSDLILGGKSKWN